MIGRKSNFKKKLFLVAILPWFKWFAYLFYNKKFLIGRHFSSDSLEGWAWVISGIWKQKILGFNRTIPFPCHPTARIHDYRNIIFHPDNLDNFQSPGIYLDSTRAKIYIGKGTYLGPNVGLLTVNHKIEDLDAYEAGKDIVLGKNCWIGMSAVILPGVTLADRTIVAAGAVVTKSFLEGRCIIAGVPAKIIKRI